MKTSYESEYNYTGMLVRAMAIEFPNEDMGLGFRFKEAFSVFDKDGDGNPILISILNVFLRCD